MYKPPYPNLCSLLKGNTVASPVSPQKVSPGIWKPYSTRCVTAVDDSDSDYVNSGDEDNNDKVSSGSGNVSEVSPAVSPVKLVK